MVVGCRVGGWVAEAVYPVLPLPLNSHIEKQDRQAESFAQTRHGAQTQYKWNKENLYPSVNLIKTLYRSYAEQKLGACSLGVTLHPHLAEEGGWWWWWSLKHSQAVLKSLSVPPSHHQSSRLREQNHQVSSYTPAIRSPAAPCSINYPPAPDSKKNSEALGTPLLPSPSCIFYERNGQ